jgi:radical SAM superfamily enzyme YgiQ (UPF0313 family)
MDQKAHLDLLRTLRRTPGVRGVRVASGVRFDLALTDMDALGGYLREFVGGQLKIAPEHVCDHVLRLMRKPGNRVFEEFLTVFARESKQAGKEQYVIPYLMSAFPGTTDEDMHTLARWLANRGWKPKTGAVLHPHPRRGGHGHVSCRDHSGRKTRPCGAHRRRTPAAAPHPAST